LWKVCPVGPLQPSSFIESSRSLSLSLDVAMPHLDAATKHHILLDYSPHSRNHSLATLAARHGIAGGKGTLSRWLARWDGTPRSLEEKKRSGRPRKLSKAEVSRHVRAPILAANRAHHAVSYPQLLSSVKAKTGKELALRTLQHYGQQELGAKLKRTKKKTATERECTGRHEREPACVCVLHAH
jgi:transposase